MYVCDNGYLLHGDITLACYDAKYIVTIWTLVTMA